MWKTLWQKEKVLVNEASESFYIFGKDLTTQDFILKKKTSLKNYLPVNKQGVNIFRLFNQSNVVISTVHQIPN